MNFERMSRSLSAYLFMTETIVADQSRPVHRENPDPRRG
jgi:hypothetical protein